VKKRVKKQFNDKEKIETSEDGVGGGNHADYLSSWERGRGGSHPKGTLCSPKGDNGQETFGIGTRGSYRGKEKPSYDEFS